MLPGGGRGTRWEGDEVGEIGSSLPNVTETADVQTQRGTNTTWKQWGLNWGRARQTTRKWMACWGREQGVGGGGNRKLPHLGGYVVRDCGHMPTDLERFQLFQSDENI